jgi:hypothetical protein
MTKVWYLIMLLLTAPFAGVFNNSTTPPDQLMATKNIEGFTETKMWTNSLTFDLQSRLNLDETLSTTETRYLQNLERAHENGVHFAWLLA